MKTIKILIPIHTLPNVKSGTTITFENLLPKLRERVNVQVIWLVYQPVGIDLDIQTNPEEIILDINDYDNALEILRKNKPDLIYAEASWDLISYAFSSAGRFLNIPVFGGFYSPTGINRDQKNLINSYIKRFFENSVPTDNEKNKKQFMRRGQFFIKKYFFLFKTLNASKLNLFQSIQKCFMILKYTLSDTTGYDNMDSKFANTLHWLESESIVKPLVNNGFDRSSLVVTGNPMYDKSYEKIAQFQLNKNTDKLRVLLLPSTHYEHGFWTKKQRDFVITKIVKKITEDTTQLSLIVKIHPSTANLSDYESIINSINPNIKIHQKGEVLDFLNDVDVIVSFWFGSAEVYALLAKKPIIICNFFNEKGDVLLQRGLALECKEVSALTDSIKTAISSNSLLDKKRDDFIQEVLYKWDGKASDRICDAIMDLLQHNQKLD
jgi:hypothetical protein